MIGSRLEMHCIHLNMRISAQQEKNGAVSESTKPQRRENETAAKIFSITI